MKLTRRDALKSSLGFGAVLAAPGLISRANAAEFTYKFGHGFPLKHPFNIYLEKAADQIAEKSNGRMKIEIFGNSQLGGDTQMLSQVRANAIQFFEGGGIILSILVPEASLSGLAFIFKDSDAVWSALDGDVGAYIRTGFDKVGLHAFEHMWDNGFRQISTSTNPVKSPSDLDGLKLRVPPGKLYTSTFKSLGAAPTNINLAEAYSALQTGLVSGQENPLVVFDTAKFYEVQKYISMTSHIWDGVWLFANQSAWKALPQDLQEIVADGFNQVGLEQRKDIESKNNSLVDVLKKKGIKFNYPEQGPFRDKLKKAGYYKEWSKNYSPDGWRALEKYVGKLT